MAAYRRLMTHVTCRLTVRNRDQLLNPALGNRVWAAFTFYTRLLLSTRAATAFTPRPLSIATLSPLVLIHRLAEGRRPSWPLEWPNTRLWIYGGLLLRSWWRGSVVERRSLAGELSLSCARPAADG